MRARSGLAAPPLLLLLKLIFVWSVRCAEPELPETSRTLDGGSAAGNSSVGKLFVEEVIINGNLNASDAGTPVMDHLNSEDLTKQILAILSGNASDRAKPGVPLLLDQDRDQDQDQDASQSQTVILTVEDLADLENLEHVLTASEYEPQKLDRKSKRKTSQPPDGLLGYDGSVPPTPMANVYYEVPRKIRPKVAARVLEPSLTTTLRPRSAAALTLTTDALTTITPIPIEDDRYYEVPRKSRKKSRNASRSSQVTEVPTNSTSRATKKTPLGFERSKKKFNSGENTPPTPSGLRREDVAAAAASRSTKEAKKRQTKKVPSSRVQQPGPQLPEKKRRTYADKSQTSQTPAGPVSTQPTYPFSEKTKRKISRMSESPLALNAALSTAWSTPVNESDDAKSAEDPGALAATSSSSAAFPSNHSPDRTGRRALDLKAATTSLTEAAAYPDSSRKRKKKKVVLRGAEEGPTGTASPIDNANAANSLERKQLTLGDENASIDQGLLAKYDVIPRGFRRSNLRTTNFRGDEDASSVPAIRTNPPPLNPATGTADTLGQTTHFRDPRRNPQSAKPTASTDYDVRRTSGSPEVTVNPIVSYVNNPTSVTYEELQKLVNPRENYRKFTGTFVPYPGLPKKRVEPKVETEDEGSSGLRPLTVLPGSHFVESYVVAPTKPYEDSKVASSTGDSVDPPEPPTFDDRRTGRPSPTSHEDAGGDSSSFRERPTRRYDQSAADQEEPLDAIRIPNSEVIADSSREEAKPDYNNERQNYKVKPKREDYQVYETPDESHSQESPGSDQEKQSAHEGESTVNDDGDDYDKYKHKKYQPIYVRSKYQETEQEDQNQNPSVQYDTRNYDKQQAEESAGVGRQVEDQQQDHTDHHHKHDEAHKGGGGGDKKFEKGGGAEHEEEHHKTEKEHGDKGYKSWHEHEKGDKGHHDKEQQSGHFDESEGEEKKHEEEEGFHKEHHHGEKGEKGAEFGEKGEHKKGHSTKGEHFIHKKDEFEKKTEFFDEFHEDGDSEKEGEYKHEHEEAKGGHEKVGHHDEEDHEDKYGKEKKYKKGGHYHEHKGHKADEGHGGHHHHEEKYGKKEGHEGGKKWAFKNGDDGGHKKE